MNEEDLGRLEAGMRALRAEYLADAPERIRELSAALGRLRTRDLSALADLQLHFHRLAGSGGSYGFPDITARGRAAEIAVAALAREGRAPDRADFAALERHVLGLAEAFQEARRIAATEQPL